MNLFAGSGQPGLEGEGGHRLQARFVALTSVAAAPSGAVYVVDGARVRRITPDGRIDTVAGSGQRGYDGDGGKATAAALNVRDVAVAPDESLYLADYLNNRVRRVRTDGVIETLAGTGEPGYGGDRGPAWRARLNLPGGVALDAEGSLYIGDSNIACIRKVWFATEAAVP